MAAKVTITAREYEELLEIAQLGADLVYYESEINAALCNQNLLDVSQPGATVSDVAAISDFSEDYFQTKERFIEVLVLGGHLTEVEPEPELPKKPKLTIVK